MMNKIPFSRRILTLISIAFISFSGTAIGAQEPKSKNIKSETNTNTNTISDKQKNNTRLDPKAALNRLLEGNDRFVKDKTICPERHQERRLSITEKQRPFAVILGCSDSRIPPEIAFDQGLGELFVVRIAGNIVGPEELDSVEYSAIYNYSSIILVLGHSNCGAVEAVIAGNTKDIESIANLIRPAIGKEKDLNLAIIANIKNSVNRIKASPPIIKLMQEGKIDVVGGIYDLATGKVTLLSELN